MNYIHKITVYVVVGAVILIFLAAACAGAVIFIRRRGKERLQEDGRNYRTYEVADAVEFIPIENIRDDMIVDEGGHRFLAVIKCRGSDFYKSNLAEKVRIKNNYVAFLQALTGPISYRQHGEDIDMGHTFKRYQAAYDKCLGETFHMTENYKEHKGLFDKIRGTGDPQEEELAEYLVKSQKKIEAYNWRLIHLESQMRYIEQVSGPGANQQRALQTYVVEWECGAGVLSEALTEEELYKKASIELDKTCRSMIHQLAAAGVTAIRCSTPELIDICRRHFRPVTGNRYTMQDVMDSTFGEGIITTDGLDQMDKELDAELADRFLS